MNRPQRPGKSPSTRSGRSSIGIGGLANGGGVEAMQPGDVPYEDASFDANTQTRFQPASGFANFLSGGKASAQANQLNANSILQDQANRNALANRVAEINATHAATLADQERAKSELGSNYINYANANNIPMDSGTSPLSAKGLGSYYMAKYGGGTPFVEGVNKEKTLRNQNTNLDLTNEAQNTPEYGNKYKEHILDSLQAAVNDALLAGTKSRFELNKFSQNAPTDLAASGVESNVNLGRARNTLTNLPAENVANLSTLKARPYANADALVSGGRSISLGNGYHLLNNITTGFKDQIVKTPSEHEQMASLLPDKNGKITLPRISVSPFDSSPGLTVTDETGKSKTYGKIAASNPAVDSILSPVTALQRAREPFNGPVDNTTLAEETQRNPEQSQPSSRLSPLQQEDLDLKNFKAEQRAIRLMKQNKNNLNNTEINQLLQYYSR